MMKVFKALAFTLVCGSLFTSCESEMPWSGPADQGGIALNFQSDGRVMRQTRADDSLSPVVPDQSQFGVSLVKSDNSYSKKWTNVDSFNKETSFPIGDYTISASYGDINQEGFTNPYYYGVNSVHVSPGVTTDVHLTATLANAMVSIRYTEDFEKLYKSHSAAVQTEGHDWVVFAQNENRPAYIAPSDEVKLNLTLTNEAGNRVTVQPASFKAAARHHYVVTFGVTGDVNDGTLGLDVQFDEDVVAETIPVSLGDELFTAPAPSLTANGYTVGEPIEAIENSGVDSNPEFHVFAFGGLKEVTVNVISDNGYTPSFGKSVKLINADALTQQQLENDGLNCYGFFKNVDKMGVINLKNFLEKLPVGKYTIQVEATDAMGRTTENPLQLEAIVSALEITLQPVGNVDFLSSELTVDLLTNSKDVKDKVVFKVPNANNKMVETTIKNIETITTSNVKTRAAGSYHYRYTLDIEPACRNSIDVEMSLRSNASKKVETQLTVKEPEYNVEVDAFTDRAVLKFTGASSEIVKMLIDNVAIYNGDNAVPTANLYFDKNAGMVIVAGLTPSVTYTSIKTNVSNFVKIVPPFVTEAEATVPNGDFSSANQTISISGVQVGGKYKVSPIEYTIKSSITASTPNEWANINELTCYTGSSNQNTWFLVPSTYVNNGQVIVRSVGYNHAGTTPGTTGGAASTTYYCTNAPSDSQLEKAAGELFLGSYSYNGNVSRTDGVSFNSRPSGVSFDYSYTSVNNEKAEALVKILDASGAILTENTLLLNSVSTMQNKIIELPSYEFAKKAAKLIICFKSTSTGVTPVVNIPTGKSLNEGISLGNKTIAANTYHALAVGSVLTVDNVRVLYNHNSANMLKAGKRK